jgi:hypothetical protein
LSKQQTEQRQRETIKESINHCKQILSSLHVVKLELRTEYDRLSKTFLLIQEQAASDQHEFSTRLQEGRNQLNAQVLFRIAELAAHARFKPAARTTLPPRPAPTA